MRTAGAQCPREAWRNRRRRKAVSSNQDFGRCRNASRLFVVGSEGPWKTTMAIATHSSLPIACASRLRAVIANFFQRHWAVLKGLGPYAAIVLFLPGGSLLAPLLWLYRRRQRLAKAVTNTRIAAVATSVGCGKTTNVTVGQCAFSRTPSCSVARCRAGWPRTAPAPA